MEISASMVKELRTATGAGVLDCRKALETSGGDMNKAAALLREKGLSAAAKKAERTANEGLIGHYLSADGQLAALVEVNCESDFVARTSEFVQFTQDLARQLAEEGGVNSAEELAARPFVGSNGTPVSEVVKGMIGKLGENMLVRRIARLSVAETGKPGAISMYVHMGSKVASLVMVTAEQGSVASNDQLQGLLKDLAMQVVAARPNYVQRQDVPADVLAKQKEDLMQTVDTGKPQQVIERIIEGKLGKFYEENCLFDQPFIRDDSKRIKDVVAEASKTLGVPVTVARFARLEVGG